MSGDENEVKIQVTKGNTVTLSGFPGVQREDTILWRFGTSVIVKVEEASNIHEYDKRFGGRLKLDNQTGSLIISDITTEDAGNYQLEIKKIGKGPPPKTFNVIVSGE